MAVEIIPADLILSEVVDQARAESLISTVIARAARFAPCILTDSSIEEAAKGILVDVISRRYTGQLLPLPGTSITAGGRTESVGDKGAPTVTFWPHEIAELQALCSAATAGQATSPVWSFPDAQPWPDGLSC